MKEARVLAMKLPRTLPTHEVTGVVKNNTYQINLLVLLETCCIEEWDRPPTFPPTPPKIGEKRKKQTKKHRRKRQDSCALSGKMWVGGCVG